MKIGFLGAGRMAQALGRGFIAAGLTQSSKIIASCAPDDMMSKKEFQNMGIKVTHDNSEVVQQSDVAVIAVKPNVVSQILKDIKEFLTTDKLLLSVAMGIKINSIEQGLSEGVRVVRVMPNTPALVRQGASVFASGTRATCDDLKTVRKLFQAVGTCEQVEEYYFDTITALSGSGPAYVYLVIEALAAGGVRMGLPWDLAYRLSAQTVLGAGSMVMSENKHPAFLRDNVTSPAGSTAEGLYYLEKGGLRASFIEAIEHATKQCKTTKGT